MRKVRVLPFGPESTTIEAYTAVGGMVRFVLVDAEGSLDPHRATAIAALGELHRRDHERRQRLGKKRKWAIGRKRRPVDAIGPRPVPERLDADAAAGRPVSVREFAGPAYDLEAQRILADRTENEDDPEPDWSVVGYADAFKKPPYGIQADLDALTHWFNSINHELFGGLVDDLDVWAWSTDWSSWFAPGHEWWGSFLWTVRPIDRPWMVAIAASTSD